MASLKEKQHRAFGKKMLALFDEPTVPSAETNETLTGAKEEKTAQSIPPLIADFLGINDINTLFWQMLLRAIRLSESDPDNPVKLSCFIEPSVLNQVQSLFLRELDKYLPQNISITFNHDEAETQKHCNLPRQGKTKYTAHTADYLEQWVSEKNAQHTQDKAPVNINSIESILQPHICPDFKEAYAQLEIMKKYTYACMENNPVLKNSYADFCKGITTMYTALSSQIEAYEKEILTHTIGSKAYQVARNEFKANIELTHQCVAKVHSIKTQLSLHQTALWQKDPIKQEKRIKQILISGCKDLNNILLSSSNKKSTVDNNRQEQIEGMHSCLQTVYRSFKKIIHTLQHPIDSFSFFSKKIGLKKEKHGESVKTFTALSVRLGK